MYLYYPQTQTIKRRVDALNKVENDNDLNGSVQCNSSNEFCYILSHNGSWMGKSDRSNP